MEFGNNYLNFTLEAAWSYNLFLVFISVEGIICSAHCKEGRTTKIFFSGVNMSGN